MDPFDHYETLKASNKIKKQIAGKYDGYFENVSKTILNNYRIISYCLIFIAVAIISVSYVSGIGHTIPHTSLSSIY